MNNYKILSLSGKTIKALLFTFVSVMAMTLFQSATPARDGATTFTTSIKFPVEVEAFVPCADGGAGEIVILTGTYHYLYHTTVHDNGKFNMKTHFQPQGLTGVGLTTGTTYHGTGVTQEQHHGLVGSTFTMQNNYNIIGQGKGNKFRVHENIQVTVHSNGSVTADVTNSNAYCK